MDKKALIFDFDGTLADSWEVIFASFESAYKKLRLPFPGRETILAHFGAQEYGILRMLTPDKADELFAEYLNHTREMVAESGMPAYSGLRELLQTARGRGLRMAVITGKSAESLEITLEATGLAEFFELLKTGGQTRSIKPQRMREVLAEFKIAASQAYYIGDAVQDIIDSREVGIEPLAAAWAKTADAQKLAAQKPAGLFTSVAALREFLFGGGAQ